MKGVAPNLSGDSLLESVRSQFSKVKDHRAPGIKVPLSDILMSGFSIFSLKFASLLKFEEAMREQKLASRLRPIYKIGEVPSDTQLRCVLDDVEPENFKKPFKHLFTKLQQSRYLSEFKFFRNKYLLCVDGTQHFSSGKIHCDSCIKKKTVTGDLRYYHQMLGACLVHPLKKTVIPMCPEPICKQDGNDKNDCERVALSRFLLQLRKDHPKLDLILTADALFTNGPVIRELKEYGIDYILSVKPGSHEKLFEAVARWEDQGQMKHWVFEEEIGDKVKKKRVHEFRYMNKALLNHADVNLSTNFVEYWETTQWVCPKTKELKEVRRHFSWVTGFEITDENCMTLMRGGRARWKIENETFNTLKNQGYEFEHNFGHGKNHLSTNFAYLMFLAFLYDQIQAIGCKTFQTVLRKCSGRISYLWDTIRSLFRISYLCDIVFESWAELLARAVKIEPETG